MTKIINDILNNGDYRSYTYNEDIMMIESVKPVIDSGMLVENLVNLIEALNQTDIVYEIKNEYDIQIVEL